MVELPSDALTTRTPGESLHRVQVIAAIHAFAEWLAENPDVPVPGTIEACAYQHGADYDAQVRRVVALAEAHNGEVGGSSSGTVWTRVHPISDTDGATVEYQYFGSSAPTDFESIIAAATGAGR